MGGFSNATTINGFSLVPSNAGVGASGWDDLQSNLFSSSSDKNSNAFEAITTNEFGSLNFNSLTPLWQLTDDFDLAGLNSTIEQSISQYALQQNVDPTSELNLGLNTGTHQNDLHRRSSDRVAESSNRWFTSLEVDPSSHAISRPESPGPESHQVDVDEAYRMRLSQNLKIKPRQEALPSTEFLGIKIFERLNKAILASGTLIAWARRNKMFDQKSAIPLALTGSEIEVHNAWCRWARKEETIRVVLALNIHDFEMASIFHHDPILRYNSKRFPSASIKALFDSPTASQWATFYQAQNATLDGQMQAPVALFPAASSPTPANFTAYAYLSSLGSQICELRLLENLDQEAKDKFTTVLLTWHQTVSASGTSSTSQSDPLCLLILWHSLLINLHSNLDLLEQALGRDSSPSTTVPVSELVTWASTPDARRCVIHALLAYKLVECIPSGAEPAIHVPQLAFATLLLELFTYVDHSTVDVSETAQGITNKQTLLESEFHDIRSFGYRIQHTLKALINSELPSPHGPGGRHDNDFAGRWKIAILPTEDDLLCTEQPFLRLADIVYETALESPANTHLKSQSRLLREDFLAELRDDLGLAFADSEFRKTTEDASNAYFDTLLAAIGLKDTKNYFLDIKARGDLAVRQDTDIKKVRFGTAFLGNPGTGKTTVARLNGDFLISVRALPVSHSGKTTGPKLANEGMQGCKKTIEHILKDGGGALFVDESYQLASTFNHSGKAVLDFLLAELGNLTCKIVFVLAGYNKQIESFFVHNPGIPSRTPSHIQFADDEDVELLANLVLPWKSSAGDV
ncbi:hypothetical protein LTR62_001679 [Meristemomyces frigidus]|uniref:ATPase AAA-type core domain-containing protein n=1 Tax=Meristemomyces frigidus TaxID=1508187 RepID=A0AAN7T7T6_9PEZI|nr:hypothetical protein LTR62_001679 [Meristemomyces frigidus]